MPPKKKVAERDETHASIDPKSMKVDELRMELQKRNLPADGLKAVLVVRLEEALAKNATESPQPIETIETTDGTENLIMHNGQVEDKITSNM